MSRLFVRVEIDPIEVEVKFEEGQNISDLISAAILAVTGTPATVMYIDEADPDTCVIVDTSITVQEVSLETEDEDTVEEEHDYVSCGCSDCTPMFKSFSSYKAEEVGGE